MRTQEQNKGNRIKRTGQRKKKSGSTDEEKKQVEKMNWAKGQKGMRMQKKGKGNAI